MPTRKASVITIFLMLVVLVAAALYIVLRDESVVQKRNSTPAAIALLPEGEGAAFTDLSGQPLELKDAFGEVVVVSTWASWCPQCAADFPKLGEVAAQFKDKNVVFLALNRGEDKYSAERYLQTITKPEAVTFVLDPTDHYFKNTTGYAMPETTVFNQKGDIVMQQRGELRIEELKTVLEEVTK